MVEDGVSKSEINWPFGIRSIHDSVSNECDRDSKFADFLKRGLSALGFGDMPIVLSGMASSTIGWRELRYAKVPLELDGSNLVHERLSLENGTPVFLISGACTNSDIMRGEETEVIGILNHEDYCQYANGCLLLLPGTHSKHLVIDNYRVIGWRTFMTGELFEALTTATILKQTTSTESEGTDEDFLTGVDGGFATGMESGLFRARVRSVLDGAPNESNCAFLSGLLIGSELSHLSHAAQDKPLLVAGPPGLTGRYQLAITQTGAFPSVVTVDLPEGAAMHGHSFLLPRWLDEGESPLA
tara:strand:- start:112 stop:1008 length:897 start_codon:yes stop_codon:yes gene_type:complete